MKKRYLIPIIIIVPVLLFLIINYFVLKNTSEYYQHNMLGNTDNIVFLHPDGHEEVVIDVNGKPLTDGVNGASYNYCHPVNDPYCHFFKDTWPWMKWGNSAEDSTTSKQRIYAFLRDYADGFKKMIGISSKN